jgi:hypothetical protein
MLGGRSRQVNARAPDSFAFLANGLVTGVGARRGKSRECATANPTLRKTKGGAASTSIVPAGGPHLVRSISLARSTILDLRVAHVCLELANFLNVPNLSPDMAEYCEDGRASHLEKREIWGTPRDLLFTSLHCRPQKPPPKRSLDGAPGRVGSTVPVHLRRSRAGAPAPH